VANQYTVRFEQLQKSYRKRQDGKSQTAFWDYLKPELQFEGVKPGESPPPGAVPVGVGLRAIGCGKLLSSINPSDSGKNHKSCKQCQQVGVY
jgi:hypothetical protein